MDAFSLRLIILGREVTSYQFDLLLSLDRPNSLSQFRTHILDPLACEV